MSGSLVGFVVNREDAFFRPGIDYDLRRVNGLLLFVDGGQEIQIARQLGRSDGLIEHAAAHRDPALHAAIRLHRREIHVRRQIVGGKRRLVHDVSGNLAPVIFRRGRFDIHSPE